MKASASKSGIIGKIFCLIEHLAKVLSDQVLSQSSSVVIRQVIFANI